MSGNTYFVLISLSIDLHSALVNKLISVRCLAIDQVAAQNLKGFSHEK